MATAPRLDRTAFGTSRLLDFVSVKELQLQCGYAPEDWPLVAVKELVDNALDACEEQGVAPEITVTVDDASLTVADNGAGVPEDVVDRLLDFSIRVSSRDAYIAPDRGAQGNALKTIVAMPFVLDGEEGQVEIAGGGVLNEITFTVDRILQRPAAAVAKTANPGSFVRIHWPERASSLRDVEARFLQVAEDFAFLNPHLTLIVDWFGDVKRMGATDSEWQKWTPASPTSPHWYTPDDLARLVAAYLAHDHDNGRERTVRELVAEFRGLSGTAKQKAILAELDLSRAPLSALTANGDLDRDKIGRLLDAMKEQSKPVKPAALGVLGREHVRARLLGLGAIEDSIQYAKTLGVDDDGLPQVTETAFGAFEDLASRRFVCGVNWSASWVNPFRTLGRYGRSLDSFLAERRAEKDEPIILLIHVAHPRVQYSDRGKSSVASRADTYQDAET